MALSFSKHCHLVQFSNEIDAFFGKRTWVLQCKKDIGIKILIFSVNDDSAWKRVCGIYRFGFKSLIYIQRDWKWRDRFSSEMRGEERRWRREGNAENFGKTKTCKHQYQESFACVVDIIHTHLHSLLIFSFFHILVYILCV